MTTTIEALSICSDAKSFIHRKHKHLIGGCWVDSQSRDTFDIIDPATESPISQAARGNKQDVDLAVKAARKAFDTGPWSKMKASERGQLLWKLADLLELHADEFAELESLDNGKPLAVAKAADVPLSIDLLRYMAGWATKIEGSTIPISSPGEYLSYTLREPVGVVGQIIPWNFPLLMAAWKLGPALATGCTVVLKPAEETPLSALRLGELICEAGYPEGVVNIVTGFGEDTGAPLAAHPDVDKVAFTGSTEVGKLIVKAAGASNLKKISLELGGKSPNIICKDADLTTAIQGAANAIFFNHGQCCCAGSRLYVHKSIYDKVIDGVSNIAKQIKLGKGLDLTTEMGPLVSDIQLKRVCAYLDAGKQEGANAIAGGKRHGTEGYFVEPTVFVNTNNDMKIVQEEIFGPVVTAMPFDDINDVVATANNSDYGLAAAVWTKDIKVAHSMAAQLRAGSVWVNCYNVFDAALPFGGYKQSGWGREMGKQVLELYTQHKAVTVSLV